MPLACNLDAVTGCSNTCPTQCAPHIGHKKATLSCFKTLHQASVLEKLIDPLFLGKRWSLCNCARLPSEPHELPNVGTGTHACHTRKSKHTSACNYQTEYLQALIHNRSKSCHPNQINSTTATLQPHLHAPHQEINK